MNDIQLKQIDVAVSVLENTIQGDMWTGKLRENAVKILEEFLAPAAVPVSKTPGAKQYRTNMPIHNVPGYNCPADTPPGVVKDCTFESEDETK